MSRPLPVSAAYLLLAVCFAAGPNVRCHEDPYVARRHPLDALFRAQPSDHRQRPGAPVGDGVAPLPASHGALAAEQQHPLAQQHQQQVSPVAVAGRPLQAVAPLAQHRGVLRRRAAEPGGPGSRHRWHADQRPAVFGSDVAPAFRALPVGLELGRPGSGEDYADHRPGGPRALDTFELPVALDPAENEIGAGPLASGVSLGRARVEAGGGRATESIDLIREQLERIKQEEDIEIKSNLLMKLLTELPEGPLPIVYIEDAAGAVGNAAAAPSNDGEDQGDDDDDDDDHDGYGNDEEDDNEDNNVDAVGRIVTEQFTPNGGKRSGRYYRRYPWKRQNSRSRTYDAEARYLCVPSREDVFKLLVGLHENRVGNHQRTVNFCNRKRPAKAIFTNIRFLG